MMPSTARNESWNPSCASICGSQSSNNTPAQANPFSEPVRQRTISATVKRENMMVARNTEGSNPVRPA